MKKIHFSELTFDDTAYIAPTWEEMGRLVFILGKQIITSGKSFEWIISIAKGGWTWSRTIADYLKLDNLASVKAKLYEGIGQVGETLTIEQTLPAGVDILDKNIFLFDDVTDSGGTLAAVRDYLLEAGAKSVTTATLFYKPTSSLVPDFYGCQTNAWVIFPHEVREFVSLSKDKWTSEGLTRGQILTRYKQLNLPVSQVKFFFNLH